MKRQEVAQAEEEARQGREALRRDESVLHAVGRQGRALLGSREHWAVLA
jgi:hypothetical protein